MEATLLNCYCVYCLLKELKGALAQIQARRNSWIAKTVCLWHAFIVE
jgi:hypothetical protein